MVAALGSIVHGGKSVDEAMRLLKKKRGKS
jgi:hypothetical protein